MTVRHRDRLTPYDRWGEGAAAAPAAGGGPLVRAIHRRMSWPAP